MTPEIMTRFLAKMTISICDYDIPRELVANFDETGLHLIPAGSESYVKVGTTQVKKIGMSVSYWMAFLLTQDMATSDK